MNVPRRVPGPCFLVSSRLFSRKINYVFLGASFLLPLHRGPLPLRVSLLLFYPSKGVNYHFYHRALKPRCFCIFLDSTLLCLESGLFFPLTRFSAHPCRARSQWQRFRFAFAFPDRDVAVALVYPERSHFIFRPIDLWQRDFSRKKILPRAVVVSFPALSFVQAGPASLSPHLLWRLRRLVKIGPKLHLSPCWFNYIPS